MGYYRSRTNNCITPYRNAGQDNCTRPDERVVANAHVPAQCHAGANECMRPNLAIMVYARSGIDYSVVRDIDSALQD